MDNVDLVKAVTDTRLNSDIASAGGLVGVLPIERMKIMKNCTTGL